MQKWSVVQKYLGTLDVCNLKPRFIEPGTNVHLVSSVYLFVCYFEKNIVHFQ
jgi:hypothetical protein